MIAQVLRGYLNDNGTEAAYLHLTVYPGLYKDGATSP